MSTLLKLNRLIVRPLRISYIYLTFSLAYDKISTINKKGALYERTNKKTTITNYGAYAWIGRIRQSDSVHSEGSLLGLRKLLFLY